MGADTVFAARNYTAEKMRVMIIFLLFLLYSHVLSLETKCLGLNVTVSVAFLFKSTTFFKVCSKLMNNSLLFHYLKV